jgi:hypothetical protein
MFNNITTLAKSFPLLCLATDPSQFRHNFIYNIQERHVGAELHFWAI